MFLCYIDESGVSAVPGNTSHFVLTGISIPIWNWKQYEIKISKIKDKYSLRDKEIHTAWILRNYTEQNKIANFNSLTPVQRVSAVQRERRSELLNLQKAGKSKQYKQTKKNYTKTEAYIHLTLTERKAFIEEVAEEVSKWRNARLFAECIDKVHFDPTRARQTVDEQAFIQLVSRFEQYLQISDKNYGNGNKNFGLLIHDNNDTVSRKHTELMQQFHRRGTLWTKIKNTIETPLFVNSELTSMVQIADLCAYAIRRYVENNEDWLFNHIIKKADQKNGKKVGIRHFTDDTCTCQICTDH